MTALLLKYHTHLMQDVRKDVIKFGWNWIKLEDVINKHATFVVIAYFIALYDTPAKITSSVSFYSYSDYHLKWFIRLTLYRFTNLFSKPIKMKAELLLPKLLNFSHLF